MTGLGKLRAGLLLVAGVIHLLPISGLLGARRLEALYGVPIEDPNLLVLMRHRAILFGLLGTFLVVAALRRELQGWAVAAGLVSAVSFLASALATEGTNQAIGRVVAVDVVAVVCLVAVAILLWVDPLGSGEAAR